MNYWGDRKKSKFFNTPSKDILANYNQPEQDSTINSTMNTDTPDILADWSTAESTDGHLRFCVFKHTGQCICANLVKFAKAREKRKNRELERTKRGRSSSSSDDDIDETASSSTNFQSTFINKSSNSSLEPSFYTAESGSTKPRSSSSTDTYETTHCYQDETTLHERSFDVWHKASHEQSLLEHIETDLCARRKDEVDSSVTQTIEPFLKRLSMAVQQGTDDDNLKQGVTDLYQTYQLDPHQFVTKLGTIIEESTVPVNDCDVMCYLHEIIEKFNTLNIQDESLPGSFVNCTVSPAQKSLGLLTEQLNNTDIHVDDNKLKFSTPVVKGSSDKMAFKTTPLLIKSSNKPQASPLFISTVTRFIEGTNKLKSNKADSAASPSTPASSSSSNSSPNRHNESSFTYLERKYVGKLISKDHSGTPELTDADKRVISLYNEQLKLLLQDSPCFTSTKNGEISNSPTSPSLSSTKQAENGSISPGSFESPALTVRNINKKLFSDFTLNSPCFSSTKHEPALKADTKDQVDKINSKDNYKVPVDESLLHEYVTQRQRCLETEKTIREIQAASQASSINCNLLNVLTDCAEYQDVKDVKSNEKDQQFYDDLNPLNLESESHTAISSSSKAKSDKQQVKADTPKPITPRNAKVTLKKESSFKHPRKVSPNVRTSLKGSKITSSGYALSIRSPITHSQRSNTRSPCSAGRLRNSRSPSPSPVRSPNSRGMSRNLIKIGSVATSPRTPLMLNTFNKAPHLLKSDPVPKLIVTPSSPFLSPSVPLLKKSGCNLKGKQSPSISPSPKRLNARGKYFNSPNKTPVQKEKVKNSKFFNTPEVLRESALNTMNVRSPIRDYIQGRDTLFVKTIKAETTKNLLSKKDTINVKLGKKETENDENRLVTEFNHPKVCYKKPSTVHEITNVPKQNLGARRQRLEEVKNSKVVIRHEGRAIPTVVQDVNADYSIHVTTVAEKTAFHLKSKPLK